MQKHCILIVDDEPCVRSSLARLLQSEGYDTLLAEGAEDGLALLEKRAVSAVISDYRMPGQSGIEFLSRVKTAYPEPIRLLLTDQTDMNEIMPAVDRGLISHLLMKPCDHDSLKKTIGRLVEEFQRDHTGHEPEEKPAKRNGSRIEKTTPDETEEGVIVLDEQETTAIPDEFLHFIPPH